MTLFVHSFSQSPDIPLDILKQPTFTNDKTVELSAIGTTPLSYQWFCDEERLTDGESYEGSTSPKLVIKIAESYFKVATSAGLKTNMEKLLYQMKLVRVSSPFTENTAIGMFFCALQISLMKS